MTKGCIYRSIGLSHPTHLLTEVLKSLPTDHKGKQYTEENVEEVLEILESMEEEDDDSLSYEETSFNDEGEARSSISSPRSVGEPEFDE